MAFFAAGGSFATCESMLGGKLYELRRFYPLPVFYVLSIGIQLGLITVLGNVWLTRIFAFLVGFSLLLNVQNAFLVATHTLDSLNAKQNGERWTLMTFTLGVTFGLSALMALLCDKLYYTNRDVTYWVYIIYGGFNLAFVVFSAILGHCLIRKE